MDYTKTYYLLLPLKWTVDDNCIHFPFNGLFASIFLDGSSSSCPRAKVTNYLTN